MACMPWIRPRPGETIYDAWGRLTVEDLIAMGYIGMYADFVERGGLIDWDALAESMRTDAEEAPAPSANPSLVGMTGPTNEDPCDNEDPTCCPNVASAMKEIR